MEKLVKKITTKIMTGKGGTKKSPEGRLYSVFGIVNNYKKCFSDYGEFIKYKGNFKAVSADDKLTLRSSTLILPEIAEDLLYSAIVAQKTDNEYEIEFGLIIGKQANETPIGYEYTVESLMSAKPNDALKLLEEKLNIKF